MTPNFSWTSINTAGVWIWLTWVQSREQMNPRGLKTSNQFELLSIVVIEMSNCGSILAGRVIGSVDNFYSIFKITLKLYWSFSWGGMNGTDLHALSSGSAIFCSDVISFRIACMCNSKIVFFYHIFVEYLIFSEWSACLITIHDVAGSIPGTSIQPCERNWVATWLKSSGSD